MIRFALLLVFLPGCGLVAGLRSDYELDEASIAAEASADAPTDATTEAALDASTDAPDAACPAPTDNNCGGPNCPKCGTNKSCLQNSDCVSDNCSNQKCKP